MIYLNGSLLIRATCITVKYIGRQKWYRFPIFNCFRIGELTPIIRKDNRKKSTKSIFSQFFIKLMKKYQLQTLKCLHLLGMPTLNCNPRSEWLRGIYHLCCQSQNPFVPLQYQGSFQ